MNLVFVPLVSFSQVTVESEIDSIEATIDSGSFRIQFSFRPFMVEPSKGEFTYHVIRYEKRGDKIHRKYYRQQYMDGELVFVNERMTDRKELLEVKEFVKNRMDPATIAFWCGEVIAEMYIKKEDKFFTFGIGHNDKEWLLTYLEKLN